MSKRNKMVNVSPESEALKALRQKVELSIRKLADRLEISPTRAHQMESGREDVPKSYIIKFLRASEQSWDDWEFQIIKNRELYELRDKCHELLNKLELSKVEEVHGFLSDLVF